MSDLPPPPDAWYHSIDLPGGRTPGLFDLDPVCEATPWPDLRGARCLDLATFDGFWAFEMERRGAAEVVALDLADQLELDWLPRHRHEAHAFPTGVGFAHAHAALGSQVERVVGNIYTIDPDELGRFDVVLLGAVLLHLRSPFAALERIRQVCDGQFLSIEQVDAPSSLLMPWRGAMVIEDKGYPWVWAVPNRAGHRALLEHSGFDVLAQTRSVMAFGPRVDDARQQGLRRLGSRMGRRLLSLPHAPGLWASMIRARPASGVPAGDHLPVATRRFA